MLLQPTTTARFPSIDWPVDSIILMTTNIGTTHFLAEQDFEVAKDLAMGDLDDQYRPEFLARFSGKRNIVCFQTLSLDVIEKIAARAKEAGALYAVDNTFLSPALQQPLSLGADLVIHSTTKYLNGHSDVVGGTVVAATDELFETLAWDWNRLTGGSVEPKEAPESWWLAFLDSLGLCDDSAYLDVGNRWVAVHGSVQGFDDALANFLRSLGHKGASVDADPRLIRAFGNSVECASHGTSAPHERTSSTPRSEPPGRYWKREWRRPIWERSHDSSTDFDWKSICWRPSKQRLLPSMGSPV